MERNEEKENDWREGRRVLEEIKVRRKKKRAL